MKTEVITMALFGFGKKKETTPEPPAPKYNIPSFTLWKKYSFKQSGSFRGCKRFKLRLSYARPICEANVDTFRKRGFDFKESQIDLLHGMINDDVEGESMLVVVDDLQIGFLSRNNKYEELFQALSDGRIERAYVLIEDVVLDDGTEAGTGVYLFLKWK